MIYATDFGQFISEKRKEFSLTATELAKRVGISTGYLSQLERSKRVNPDIQLLKKMIVVFELNEDEVVCFYELYSKVSGEFCPDISEYIQSRKTVKDVFFCFFTLSLSPLLAEQLKTISIILRLIPQNYCSF